MTDIYYFAFSIDQNNMRDTVHTVVLTAGRSGTVEVLNFLPLFGLNMLDNSRSSLINTNANDSDFFAPSFTVFFKHFLVVSHRCLTWRAPSCPKVNKHNLTSFVLNGLRLFVVNVSNFSDWDVGSSNAKLDLNFNVDSAWINLL
jgi:hypothetical protein